LSISSDVFGFDGSRLGRKVVGLGFLPELDEGCLLQEDCGVEECGLTLLAPEYC